jgi:hypothetical protein
MSRDADIVVGCIVYWIGLLLLVVRPQLFFSQPGRGTIERESAYSEAAAVADRLSAFPSMQAFL